ncbi:hypothetical protein [Agrobacterium sp. CG674]
MEYLDTYHPYWSGKLAAEYENRAGEIGAVQPTERVPRLPNRASRQSRKHNRDHKFSSKKFSDTKNDEIHQ